jgi:hypothetical protein
MGLSEIAICHIKILVKWLLFYLAGILAAFKVPPFYIYSMSTIGFFGGFLLRKFSLYPGKWEPLWLDGYTFLISLFILLLCKLFKTMPVKTGLIIIFSLHIIYNIVIIIEKNDMANLLTKILL